jgi:SagB-type dehydrogenase family enzyme
LIGQTQTVRFATPNQDGSVSLERCVQRRRSVRSFRDQALTSQDWISAAPAIICVAAVFARTTVKYGNRGRGYVYMEAGHAAESLMLQAVALGLATTMVGAFSDHEVSRLLRLGADETPLCLIRVGRP